MEELPITVGDCWMFSQGGSWPVGSNPPPPPPFLDCVCPMLSCQGSPVRTQEERKFGRQTLSDPTSVNEAGRSPCAAGWHSSVWSKRQALDDVESGKQCPAEHRLVWRLSTRLKLGASGGQFHASPMLLHESRGF